tara:strand:+ start:2757 stop:3722 length:966 start_codon:yes stop_codon:yes gene_type:complete
MKNNLTMFLNPAWFILIIAIIHASIMLLRPNKATSIKNLENSIFICIVSYKDPKWIKNVVDILENASSPNQIFIGVLEFIENADDTAADKIPFNYRNNIRVKTVSSTLATTLAKARKMCIDYLFSNEKFILLTRSATLCQDWDIILCSYMISPSIVITMPLCNEKHCIFSTIESITHENIKCSYKFTDSTSTESVKSIVWNSDFCFCESSKIDTVLADETNLGVSAYLYYNKIKLCSPGVALAVRDTHPKGVRCGQVCKIDKKIVQKFCESINIDMTKQTIGAHARLGISKQPQSQECIIKYGSVWKTNLLIEQTKSEYKQ